MAFVSHRLTLADDIHSPFFLPSFSLSGIFVPGIRYRYTSHCPRSLRKRERGRERKTPRPKTRNSSQKHSRTSSAVSLPSSLLSPRGKGNGIRGEGGAHRKRGEQWELSFITRGCAGTMCRNCVTTRVWIYYIDGGGSMTDRNVRREGGRHDMCFLAIPRL